MKTKMRSIHRNIYKVFKENKQYKYNKFKIESKVFHTSSIYYVIMFLIAANKVSVSPFNSIVMWNKLTVKSMEHENKL